MPSPAPPEPPRVVIIGGGFGGLYAARALRRAPVDVTLIDRRNHHLFQPLLYQVATAALNPSDIAAPIRSILRKQQNCRVLLAEATAVDLARRRVVLADGELGYDYLVVATGATDSYFGHEEWARLAPSLKSIEEALEIRRRVLLAYEAAERTTDADARRTWLTFVVVGAGPTGVELAGALSEIARHALERDFRTIDPQDARVVLVEAADRVLGTFPPDLSEKATAQLVRLGVEVRVGTKVTEIDAGGVCLGSERVAARTVVWAAGVKASPLARSLGVPLDRAGRVLVEPTLTLPGHPEVFVIGDLAVHQQDGKAFTGLAAVAVQEGPHAAANIVRAVRGEPLVPFRYVDKGTLATIGRAAAVANFGRVHLSGFIAWLAWLFVHIFLLIGFRNRFVVMFEWAWTYLTYERGARLITGEVDPLRDAGAAPPKAE
ncbi:MAG TPA: NAD(P)/FAD-dependent oxidoreductase [Candidatus Eisenbacteria bacterium]|nr:NAD(P)/FAD-dependent oxidoreductase [Candidatus Eisenbacteria bacterium]